MAGCKYFAQTADHSAESAARFYRGNPLIIINTIQINLQQFYYLQKQIRFRYANEAGLTVKTPSSSG
jgi:hypothetical protein